MKLRNNLLLAAALLLLAVPVQAQQGQYLTDGTKPVSGGVNTPGATTYSTPQDGICVVGVKPDGTLLVDNSVTDYQACQVYTTGLTGMTTQAACTVAGATGNTDGAKHKWSTGLCAIGGVPTSRSYLDVNAKMCTALGGTVEANTVGHCVAYGWTYQNSKIGEAIPYRGTLGSSTTGRADGDKLGFCYATMRMTSAPGYNANSVGGCPSYHNSGIVSPGGGVSVGATTVAGTPNVTLVNGASSTSIVAGWWLTIAGAETGGVPFTSQVLSGTTPNFVLSANVPTTVTNATVAAYAVGTEWPTGTDGMPYQTRASYDAGLGWSWSSSQCTYSYGRKGYVNAALFPVGPSINTTGSINSGSPTLTVASATSLAVGQAILVDGAGTSGAILSSTIKTVAGTTITLNANAVTTVTNSPVTVTPLAVIGGVAAAANAFVDMTTLTTQGSCLANGGSWDSWLPYDSSNPSTPGATTITVPTTSTSTIVKLDATTPILSAGGGDFVSGTGAVCEKCHSDQSRSTIERWKPGFALTAHKRAGDNPTFQNAIGATWGVKGVSCEVCHATGKPGLQDVGAIVYPNTTGAQSGLPRGASGHNNTEYGSHLTGVCYQCHGAPVSGDRITGSGNPATTIPTAGGEFVPNSVGGTSIGLAPIVNQFLASPHSKYGHGTGTPVNPTGPTSRTVDVITKDNYGSTFEGWVCRDNATFGNGTIITTYVNAGIPTKIPNVDSATNLACTNAPTATPPGAGGFWVRDGEAAGTSNGIPYASTDQGNCMTCHDVHWDKNDSSPAGTYGPYSPEPFRRECTTCHANAQSVTASNAPQFNTSVIKHPAGAGTPLAGTADAACETCHMPKLTASGSPMHLWRISTTAAYQTAGASTANADGGDIKVDLNAACGQCHNSTGSAHLFDNTALAAKASGMHTGTTWPSGAYPAACVACHQNAGDAAAQQIKPYNWGLPPSDPSNAGANHHALLLTYGFTCNNAECHGDPVNFSGVSNAAARNGGGVKNIDVTQPNTAAGCIKCHTNSGPYAIHHATATTTGACTSCHGTYGGVYAVSAFSATTNAQCMLCHNAAIGTIPVINMATINHNSTVGTPTNCVQCHSAEPLVSPFNASSPSFAGCLSCHSGAGPGPTYTTAQLAAAATGMHASAGVNYQVSFSTAINGLAVNAIPAVNCGGPCPTLTYDWSWGDGNTNLAVAAPGTTLHTYTLGGSYSINLTVRKTGLKVGAYTRTVIVNGTDNPPVTSGTFTFDANTWTATLVDTSTDTDTSSTSTPVSTVRVVWGDGTTSTGVNLQTFTHKYTRAGTWTVAQTAYDLMPQAGNTVYNTVTSNPFVISGTVKDRLAANLAGAIVTITGGRSVITQVTPSTGIFNFTTVPPGAYTLVVSKVGYKFPRPAPIVTVGPSSTGITVTATAP